MRIYVANISWTSMERDLRAIFAQYGAVQHVDIPVDGSGMSRGFCVVEMGDSGEAEIAIQKLDGAYVEGKRWSVQRFAEATA